MKINTDEKLIDNILSEGVTEVIEKDHLKKALLSGKQLRVKLGFDPTGDKIHLGRAIQLRKLREFQNLGHKIIFLVGDFTAQIGDPSDKLEKRPMITKDQITKNLKTYKKQVGKIIDLRKAEFKFNSAWLKKLTFQEIAVLAESFSVNQMLARRNFKGRFEKGEEISTREFMYPLMQGYDSVVLKSDVEVGGFDQLFNLKAGRTIQKHYGMPEQDILTGVMLEGTDGRKMSTSWGNVVNITDEPNDMFGKLMSLRDDLIDKYFELCTDVEEEISGNPKEKKERLAFEIVKIYHGEKEAKKAQAEFEKVFSNKEMPTDIPEIELGKEGVIIIELLVKAKLASSKAEARRLIEQGGVRINEEKQTDPERMVAPGGDMIIQVGPRRFVRIK